jgi:hypothetical protein
VRTTSVTKAMSPDDRCLHILDLPIVTSVFRSDFTRVQRPGSVKATRSPAPMIVLPARPGQWWPGSHWVSAQTRADPPRAHEPRRAAPPRPPAPGGRASPSKSTPSRPPRGSSGCVRAASAAVPASIPEAMQRSLTCNAAPLPGRGRRSGEPPGVLPPAAHLLRVTCENRERLRPP